MKSALIPVSCGIVLTAISAAGFSHWFYVRELVRAYHANPAAALPAATLPPPQSRPEPVKAEPAPAPPVLAKSPAPAPTPVAAKPAAPAAAPNATEEFLRSLVQELRSVKDENRALQDQVEETNRDIMNLQFRVDTHSSQFRPMPMLNDLKAVDASHELESLDGVLPPLELSPLPER